MKEQNTSVGAGKLQFSIGSNLITPILIASIVLILLSLSFFFSKLFLLGYILFGIGIIAFILWLVFYVYWQVKDPSKLRSGEFEINKLKVEKEAKL
jgi:predicted membrane protein